MPAIKSVIQRYMPSNEILTLMEDFRMMVNDCNRIGLANNNVSTLRKLSQLSYKGLARYNMPSYYKLCAISRAAGILAARKKSMKRGMRTKSPYAVKPILTSCYGFKIADGILKVPLGKKQYFNIPLTKHTRQILSDPALNVRSFTLTANTISICYSKEVGEIECTKTAGIDRNLRNATYGNDNRVIQYNLSQAVDIAENTKEIIASFKRDDVRIRKKLSMKYGRRRQSRVQQLLHRVSKHVVNEALANTEAIVFEKLTGIRKLYKKGNGQGHKYRHTMNSFPFYELERQVTYKARWEGIPVIHIDPKGTSKLCPRCGERLQSAYASRNVWCQKCKKFMDRDVVAAMNLSYRGASVLMRSQGGAGEAMRGNPEKEAVILRVDASKLFCG